jgi:glycosyltransferase involved in cell wall biosynthesis
MRIALLTTDNRENEGRYDLDEPHFGTAPEALILGFRSLPDAEVHVISCLKRKVHSPEKLASNVWYHALHVPQPGWLRTGYQGCVRAVRHCLKNLCPDIVHGQGTERHCAISAVFSSFPNVITIHGNMRLIAKLHRAPPWSYMGLAAMLEDFAIPRTDGIVCITRYTERAVAGKAKKTWIINNAVDPRFFEVCARPLDPPLLLCVGQVTPRKNQLALLDALEGLANKFRFQIRFLGQASEKDPYARKFRQRASQHSWVKMIGPCDREELLKAMSQASLLILPSIEDNCPMVILEAAAAGVPVLASRLGGIPELIQEGVTGYLFEPQIRSTLPSQMGSIFSDAPLASQVAAAAREQAVRRFHPNVIAAKHLEIYGELLARKSHKPKR